MSADSGNILFDSRVHGEAQVILPIRLRSYSPLPPGLDPITCLVTDKGVVVVDMHDDRSFCVKMREATICVKYTNPHPSETCHLQSALSGGPIYAASRSSTHPTWHRPGICTVPRMTSVRLHGRLQPFCALSRRQPTPREWPCFQAIPANSPAVLLLLSIFDSKDALISPFLFASPNLDGVTFLHPTRRLPCLPLAQKTPKHEVLA